MNSNALAEAAHDALKKGELARAQALFAEAATAEASAFRAVPASKPRTRGILAISTASLIYKSGQAKAAERFVNEAFSGADLPTFARQALRELLQVIWNEFAQGEAGISFAQGQVLVSVRGGDVVTGGAPLDLILGKVQAVQSMFYRTVEYMLGLPHRHRGPTSREIQEKYRPWLFQSVPGSYQFAVAIQKPAQKELFEHSEIEPEVLTEKFLDIVRSCSEGSTDDLEQVVKEPDYRTTFLKMTRSLAPSGKTFSEMEIRGGGNGSVDRVVLSVESRKFISENIRSAEPDSSPRSKEEMIRGNLRAIHLDKDWLELAVGGETKRISGLSEAVDDVIGPMVNHDVTVHVRRGAGKKLIFLDIEQDD